MAKKVNKVAKAAVKLAIPLLAEARTDDSGNKVRRNAAGTIPGTDKYSNILEGFSPFNYSSYGSYGGESYINVREPVIVCQYAYWNFASFANIINLMTEFSVNNIHFEGGSVKSRQFFTAWLNKINYWGLQGKFFREFYRSSNVPIYRLDGKVDSKDLAKLTQTFGAVDELSLKKDVNLPVRYIILNPADLAVMGCSTFSSNKFYKVLSNYELECLKNPKTDEDREVYNGLPPEVKKQIKEKKTGAVLLPLDPKQFSMVFNNKQDYEPFASPMGFPVMENINRKQEMQKIDMAIARTAQQAILLVTMGYETKNGEYVVDSKQIEAMQALFENQSVSRTICSDFTTKISFVTPDVSELLDPKKYEVIDRDINEGLNNILVGGEKFANQSLKIQIFVERLNKARAAFLNEFLIPEIKRISKELGFKNFPTPVFQDVNLKDELEFSKLYTRLIELGTLTPAEGLEAIDNGRLPTKEESLDNQKEFKSFKDDGLYEPLLGQKKEDEAGRPGGTKAPKSKHKVTPVGGSTEIKHSAKKLRANLLIAAELDKEVKKILKKKFKIKEFNEAQASAADQVAEIIISNESPENWLNKVDSYVDAPADKNPERVSEIQEIAASHGLDTYSASLLYASRI